MRVVLVRHGPAVDREDPDCPPDATVPYYLEREVGGDVYARAYALAENLTRDIGEHHAPMIDVSISATR